MDCGLAEAAIVERELGSLAPGVAATLELHLGGCPGCRAAAVAEREFVRDLAALRTEIPFSIDVTPRIMSRLSARWRRSRHEVTTRQLGICAAVALGAAIALAATVWGVVPEFDSITRGVGSQSAGLFGFAERMLGVALGLVSIPIKLLVALLRSAAGLLPALNKIQPLATGSATLAMMVMMTTIACIVVRDWARQGSARAARSDSR